MTPQDPALQERVLILAPTAKDAATTARLLNKEGISTMICRSLAQVCDEACLGGGAAILPEEAIINDREQILNRALSHQPAWSDFPLIILTQKRLLTQTTFTVFSEFQNFTLLERPMQIAILISSVKVALRDRKRQYKLRDDLIARQKTEELLRIADRRKDEFLAILGHELRNPLAAISSGVELLNRESTSEEIKKVVRKTLEHQIKVMTHLINDLLDVSRISSGKIRLKKIAINLNEAIERVIEVVRPMAESAGLKLIVKIKNEELWAMADPARVEQILSNLLSNAVKYTNKGGTIQLRAFRQEDKAVIAIKDTGIGIPEHLLPHIFELFTQAETSLARSKGGLGIGLTLVQKLVEMHGGKVFASSAGENQGSTFTVELPRIDKPKEDHLAPPPAREIKKNTRVIIVDDNQDAAQTLALFLQEYGCKVETAFNGTEALSKARQFHPEAALLDIGLPDINGYELAQQLSHMPELNNILLIAITGYNEREDRKLSKISGFRHHLAKPVDHDLLLKLLA